MRAIRLGVPLLTFHVVDRNKSRFAAHGQANIATDQVAINLFTKSFNPCPLFITIGFGHPRVFMDAFDAVVKLKGHFTFIRSSRNRCSTGVMRRTSQRDMAFTGKQARSRVKPDPSRTGDKNLGPGMQVGEIRFGS